MEQRAPETTSIEEDNPLIVPYADVYKQAVPERVACPRHPEYGGDYQMTLHRDGKFTLLCLVCLADALPGIVVRREAV